MGRRRMGRDPCSIAGKLKNRGLVLLLFETPTGFAIFRSSEIFFDLPDIKKKIWANFADEGQASLVVMLKEFQTFKDKASAINVTGVDEELARMINRWLLPGMKLAVGKHEYKTILELKLEITCVHNDIVMEIMWGIQHLMHKLVRKEKAEVAKEDRLPMSEGLKMLLRKYEFDVEPEMVNEQIVKTASALYECDDVDNTCSTYLHDISLHLKNISGIDCGNWSLLKLATAVKVIFCPEEEEGDNYCEVLSKDEQKKLKNDASKYYGILSEVKCLRTYQKIRSAHQVRIEKKKLLKSLILPLVSASKLRYVNELSLLKGPKRSWDSAFDPVVLSKSTLSLGETEGGRIARISGAQPSTSKAIVPYKPFLHAVLLNSCAENQSQSIDVDNMDGHNINLGISTLPPRLTEPVEKVLVHGIEEVNIVENDQQSALQKVQVDASSCLLPILPNKRIRRSPRLNKDSGYEHVQLKDTRKQRKKIHAPDSSSLSLVN